MRKVYFAVLAIGSWITPHVTLAADPVGPSGSTATVIPAAAGLVISPARYSASIMPSINSDMRARLEKAFNGVPGLKDAKANVEDSSIHFTITSGAKVRTADPQKLVTNVDANAVMSTPILEHSMATLH